MIAARAFETGLLLAWLVVLYVLVRAVIPRVKNAGRASDVIAAGAVVIFVLGSAWHPTTRLKGLVVQAPAPGAVAPAAAPMGGLRPVACPAGVAPKSGAPGHIDAIIIDSAPVATNSVVTASTSSHIQFGGWAATGKHPAKSVCFVVDGKIVMTTGSYGIARPDVATAFNAPDMAATGFDISAPPMTRGTHRVSVASVDGAEVRVVNQTVTVIVR